MAINLLMPALSPTMKEGTLAKWNKKEGDPIKIGEVIAEIETDKAIMEFESIDEGTLGKILIPAGTENVSVNEVIAILLEEGEELSTIEQASKNQGVNNPAVNIDLTSRTDDLAPVEKINLTNDLKSNEFSKKNKQDIEKERIFISPLAKRIASQNSIDITNVNGSGPNGRIIKEDVEKIINIQLQDAKTCTLPEKKSERNKFSQARNLEEITKVPNNNMRKVIAKRLAESKRDIPHFYLEIECEMDRLLELRKQINASKTPDDADIKISVNDLIIKAIALSLKQLPEANASWSDEAILQYNNVDISVAVAIKGGLITPIIRNADQKSLSMISEEMKDLASRARNSALKPEEFQGGSFTISNLGMFGIDSFKAIINPPQSAILAIGSTSEKPIVKNGAITVGSIMKVTLSADHRVIDGAIGAKLLVKFKEYIESPAKMLIY